MYIAIEGLKGTGKSTLLEALIPHIGSLCCSEQQRLAVLYPTKPMPQHHYLEQQVAQKQHDDVYLQQLYAARSYWHGNGFLKVVLLDKGYKLRLHIWFAGTSCEENIHSHRWGFASHVLTGTLKSELWADAANDELHTSTLSISAHKGASSKSHRHQETQRHACEYRYTAKHQHERHTIEAHKQLIGTARLQKLQNIAQSAGASYVMTPSQLHRINHPGQELVATIICTAPTAVLTNRLFPTTDQPKLHPAKLSADALKIALTRYLEHISPMPLAA